VLLYGFLMLWSMGETRSRQLYHTKEQWYQILFYMLVSYWILTFMTALYQFIVAYALVLYYYEPADHDGEKDVNGCMVAFEGFHVGVVYHTGSLAFGSLLIAILCVLQKIIEYAETKNHEAGDNCIVSCILACLACCVNCCKECVEFVNKNAWIEMAIESNGFCASARAAISVIMEAGGAMAILNGATFVFTLFGCATNAVLSGLAGFLGCQLRPEVDDIVPVIIVSQLLGLLVSLSFMNLFDMASDTLLYCYANDLKDGTANDNAPEALKELVANHQHDYSDEEHD